VSPDAAKSVTYVSPLRYFPLFLRGLIVGNVLGDNCAGGEQEIGFLKQEKAGRFLSRLFQTL
jgi:hypothetical protein